MSLVRFDPWSFMGISEPNLDRNWVPAVDIEEHDEHFIVRADVPGVAADEIDISLEAGVLSISGERQTQRSEEHHGMARFERVSGRFNRRFKLPRDVDAEQVTAASANGILEVTIPKQAALKPRRITVQAA
ncbi:MAG: Hsp20/alpha crystallin family protein [Pseudomonadota bacterium]